MNVSVICDQCINKPKQQAGLEETPKDKPPLGVKPRWLMLENRNREIIEAMHRHVDACLDNSEPITLDPKWIMELFENNKELLARCKS